MRRAALLVTLFACVLVTFASAASKEEDGTKGKSTLNDSLRKYVVACIGEFDQIPPERQEQLRKIAAYVGGRVGAGLPANLTFVCTHNSRRSQIAELWAAAGAAYYGVPNVEAFSGGTEATAFNPRAVAALERAGFKIAKLSEDDNPKYRVEMAEGAKPLICFSKTYYQEPNPSSDYCAVMTCAAADKACPIVMGATMRVAIPYDDPKDFDGTPQETAKYSERCAQIAREMLYVFSQVKSWSR
jgi:protein-tyrosine-phosphatase